MGAWAIDNTQAGWITGLFYLAYTVSVPVLVTLTDRVDPKRIYLLGVALTVVGHVCFALFADGFWTAAFARVLAGIGWAGTYMTGLKLLADRVEGRSEEHTSELQSLMRISYAVFCLQKKNNN